MDTGVSAAPGTDAAPDDRSRVLAALAVGCFWGGVPIIGPLILRAFMGNRPFALHYFRLALVIQVVFVVGVGFSAINNVWPETSRWTGAISLPAWLWALYGSFVCLLAAIRGELRGLRPIPRSWIWAPRH